MGGYLLPITWDFRVFHPDDREKFKEHIERVKNGKDNDIHELEYSLKTKSGKWIRCISRDSVYESNPDGSVKSLIGSFMDISG